MQAMEHQQQFGQGERVFVASVLLAIAVIAGLTLVGTGLHFNWVSLVLGLLCCGVLMYSANGLYSGQRLAGQVLLIWTAGMALLGVVLAALALAVPANLGRFLLPGLAQTWLLVGVCLMVVLVGAVVFGSRDVRAFLAARRGEALTPAAVAPEEDGVFVIAEGKPVLAEKPLRAAGSLKRDLLLASGLLTILAAADVAGAVFLLVTTGNGFGLLLAGLFAGFLGQVLLTASGDMDHLASTRGYEVAHLTFGISSFQMFLNVLLAATGLFVLLLVLNAVWS
jgi:hypothetical protein